MSMQKVQLENLWIIIKNDCDTIVIIDGDYGKYAIATIVLEENPSIICNKLAKHIISCEELDKEIKMLPEYMQQFFKNVGKRELRLYAAKYYRNGLWWSNCNIIWR